MCRIFCQLSCLDEIPVINFLPLFRLAPEFKALHLHQLVVHNIPQQCTAVNNVHCTFHAVLCCKVSEEQLSVGAGVVIT